MHFSEVGAAVGIGLMKSKWLLCVRSLQCISTHNVCIIPLPVYFQFLSPSSVGGITELLSTFCTSLTGVVTFLSFPSAFGSLLSQQAVSLSIALPHAVATTGARVALVTQSHPILDQNGVHFGTISYTNLLPWRGAVGGVLDEGHPWWP